MKNIKKLFALIMVFILCLGMSMTAFATTGWECGPTDWLYANGTSIIPGTITATSNGSCYVGGACSLMSTSAVQPREITMIVALYNTKTGATVRSAIKTMTAHADGPMVTDPITWKSSSKFDFTKGMTCAYQVTRMGFADNMYGTYLGYLSD